MKSAQEQAGEIVESIELARRYQGISQRALAAKAGTTESNYSSMKTMKHMPSLWMTISCANAVGMRVVLVPAEEGKRHE